MADWIKNKLPSFSHGVYGFGVSRVEKEEMANMLNCVLGDLPLKYLGIPISDHHLAMGAFSFLP